MVYLQTEMKKYKNKYRIQSARLQTWNYGWAGAYFITICTQKREHYFGEVKHGKMVLSNIGVIANIFWYEIKNHTQNIELGEFVIMPNHVHGILILKNVNNSNKNGKMETTNSNPVVVETLAVVETLHATSLPNKNSFQMAKISPKSNSISTIIRSYKSAVTKHAHRLAYDFAWQSSFWDNIIHEPQSFQNISKYILNNPLNWKDDKFYKE